MDKLKTRFLTHNLINTSYIIGSIEQKLINYKNRTDKESILIDLDVSIIFLNELNDDEFISDEFKKQYYELMEKIKENLKNGEIEDKTLEDAHNILSDLERDITEQIIYIIK